MRVTIDVSTKLNSQDLRTVLLRYFNNRHIKYQQNDNAATNKYAIFLVVDKRCLYLGGVVLLLRAAEESILPAYNATSLGNHSS